MHNTKQNGQDLELFRELNLIIDQATETLETAWAQEPSNAKRVDLIRAGLAVKIVERNALRERLVAEQIL